jgi:hypothetical protein
MPAMLDSSSYDLFSYKHYDETPLSLEEASRRAEDCRRKDPDNFYRVSPANEQCEGFYIDRVSPLEIYTELWSQLALQWARMLAKGLNLR